MKTGWILLTVLLILQTSAAKGEASAIWKIVKEGGDELTEICEKPSVGDEYISAENEHYEIESVQDGYAVARYKGNITLPSLDWLEPDAALPVSSRSKQIAMYCTHSDESYKPSDGFYSTTERGTIYEVADALADALRDKGINAVVSSNLHHPHDAGAYRRSRQTAVELLKTAPPDCLIDIHRDGIPNPASYEVTIGGENVSKIRLLVGRGNQNAEVNRQFALLIKAVADRVYPGLIKDIYMGKGTFNQDLLPQSILFECGTYTLEKERVLKSMPMMADVLSRSLYGGIVGSAGRVKSGANAPRDTTAITEDQTASIPMEAENGIGSGAVFLGGILFIGIVGFSLLSAGSWRGGMRKAGRSISEMTGGLIGKRPRDNENHNHS